MEKNERKLHFSDTLNRKSFATVVLMRYDEATGISPGIYMYQPTNKHEKPTN